LLNLSGRGGAWHAVAHALQRRAAMESGGAAPGAPAEITAIGRKALRQGERFEGCEVRPCGR